MCLRCLKSRLLSILLLILLGIIGFFKFNESGGSVDLLLILFLTGVLANFLLEFYFIFTCKNSGHGR